MTYNFDTHNTLQVIYNRSFNQTFWFRFNNDICSNSPKPCFTLAFHKKLKSEQYFGNKNKKEHHFEPISPLLYIMSIGVCVSK